MGYVLLNSAWYITSGHYNVSAPGNIYVTPLRFELGGRPVLSARFNVETAASERKRPEI
jgi:hypothetical protein